MCSELKASTDLELPLMFYLHISGTLVQFVSVYVEFEWLTFLATAPALIIREDLITTDKEQEA